MKLYHGSLEIVEVPEIRIANRRLDYGGGFYATTSASQAEAWVRRKMKETRAEKGYVNEYELNEGDAAGLRQLIFERADEAWLDFVMANRTQKEFEHDYDLVCGPVANDKVYACFALYEGGLFDKSMLIAELRTYRLVDQYLFHTSRALGTLTFLRAKAITP